MIYNEGFLRLKFGKDIQFDVKDISIQYMGSISVFIGVFECSNDLGIGGLFQDLFQLSVVEVIFQDRFFICGDSVIGVQVVICYQVWAFLEKGIKYYFVVIYKL